MNIESYNFSDAERIQLGKYPTLDTLVHRWARHIEESLFALLGVEVYAGASVVEEMRFSTFFETLKTPRPLYLFTLPPLKGRGLLVLDNRFAHLVVSRQGADKGPQALTPQNQKLLQNTVQRLMVDFNQCWADVHPITTKLEKVTTYLFRARILNGYEPCLVAHIHLSGHQIDARMSLCLPRVMLETVLRDLEQRQLVPSLSLGEASEKPDTAQLLEETPFRLRVTLGQVETPLGPELTVGKVLPIRSAVGGEAVVEVNGQPMLVGTLGDSNGQYAVKVTGTYQQRKRRPVSKDAPFKPLHWPSV